MPRADKHPFLPLQLDQISFTLVSLMIYLFLEGCIVSMLSTNLIMLRTLSDPSEHFLPSHLSSSQHSCSSCTPTPQHFRQVLSCAHPENSIYMVEQRWKERMRQEWGRPKHSPFEWNVIKISVFQSYNACQSCIWFCGGPLKAGDSSRNKRVFSIWLAQNGVKGTISLQLQSSGMKSPSILGRHAMWTAVIQCPTWKQSGRKQSGLNPKLDF